jgi:phosphoribosyl-ATP pyrophosphohydrolase
MQQDILATLSQTINERLQSEDASASYVAKLHAAGLDKILEKVGEEAVETILAAKNAQASGNNEKLIYETADLLFHSMVMLAELGSDIDEVVAELGRRFGMSGIEEKASRKQ